MQADRMHSRSQNCRAMQPPPAAQPLPWHVISHRVSAGQHEHQKAVFVQFGQGCCHSRLEARSLHAFWKRSCVACQVKPTALLSACILQLLLMSLRHGHA